MQSLDLMLGIGKVGPHAMNIRYKKKGTGLSSAIVCASTLFGTHAEASTIRILVGFQDSHYVTQPSLSLSDSGTYTGREWIDSAYADPATGSAGALSSGYGGAVVDIRETIHIVGTISTPVTGNLPQRYTGH